MIKHDDGTIARYIHLANNGVLVKKGDCVKRGQVIALSGNTGDTGGAHFATAIASALCITCGKA